MTHRRRCATHYTLGLSIPALVLIAVAYPVLWRLDATYWQNYHELQHSTYALLAQGPDLIKTDRAGFAMRFFPRVLAYGFIGPQRLFPSTVIGLAGVAVVTISISMYFAYTALRGRRPSHRLHVAMPDLLRLEQRLGIQFVGNRHRERYLQVIQARISGKRPYLRWGRSPMMAQTCATAESLHILGLGKAEATHLRRWILSCECPQGGFGPAPGLAPDLLHTESALRTLQRNAGACAIDTFPHRAWLELAVKRLLAPDCPLPNSDWLFQTRLVTESLAALEPETGLRVDDLASLSGRVVSRWHDSRRTAVDTLCLLQVLDKCHMMNHPIMQEIRATWLPQQERRLLSLRPDSGITDIGDLLDVLSLLFPTTYRTRPIVEQVTDSLWRVWGEEEPPACGAANHCHEEKPCG